VWHNIIEFSEPVKTVEQASKQVDAERIAKSIVMIDSNGEPLLAIVAAKSKISHRKLKDLLDVRDVRLASPKEVLLHSGYPVGGVPPFNNIRRVIVDPKVLNNETSIFGGGDIDKLLEVRTRDVVEVSHARINDITQEVTGTQSS
jgi:prolyl-tRNA editing enzyme YbaK/EbsC (Cys-tRNA(Pro) deacylase)